ncbi:hypothetical protein AO738_27940 [Pseudomonas citronellolis]|nr:hypothetical protein AO738_27940 [Pseudomonas citronellolis]
MFWLFMSSGFRRVVVSWLVIVRFRALQLKNVNNRLIYAEPLFFYWGAVFILKLQRKIVTDLAVF